MALKARINRKIRKNPGPSPVLDEIYDIPELPQP